MLLSLAVLAALSGAGCVGSAASRRVERPVAVTHKVAFGDYRRVFNTAYHIVNRYGVVQRSSYRYGEITALVSEDTSLFDKTRKTIQARIVDAGDSWDVQCRVLVSVEDSEVAAFEDQFQPLYNWKTVASDPRLEVRLNNEIRAALSGGAWEAKEPLTPEPRRPADPPARPRRTGSAGAEDEGEVSNTAPPVRSARRAEQGPDARAFERLGVARMRRGRYAEAARAFRAAGAAPGESPFATLLLAQALFSEGSFLAAQRAVEEGARRNPRWPEADFDVRELYADGSSVFAQRLAELDRAAGADARLGLLAGYMHYCSGDYAGALRALDAYLEHSPSDAVARRYREEARARVDRAHGVERF